MTFVPAAAALAALPLAALLAFSGFTAFSIPQGVGALAVLLGLAVASLGLAGTGRLVRARRDRLFAGAAGLLLVWGIAQLLLRDGSAAARDAVVPLAALLVAAVTLPPLRRAGVGSGALAGGLAVAALAQLGAAVAQALGAEFPPPIPYVMSSGVRGLGDGSATGATLALATMLAALAFPSTASARARAVSAGAAIAAGAAAGLAGTPALVAPVALVALAAGAIALPRAGVRLAGPALAAPLVALALSPVHAPAEGHPSDALLDPNRPAFDRMVVGPAAPWDEPRAVAAWTGATLRMALSEPFLGHGPTALQGEAGAFVSPGSAYAQANADGLPRIASSPSPLLELAALWGVTGPLALLAMVALALFPLLRSRSEPRLLAACAGVVALLAVGPGALAVLPLALLVAAMAGGLAAAEPDGAAPTTRANAVALAAIATIALAHGALTARWSYLHAGATVFLGAGRLDQADAWLARAAAAQSRFETHYDQGLILALPREGDAQPDAAVAAFSRALELAPEHSAARFALADMALRSLGRIAESPEEGLRKRQSALALLRQIRDTEPNHIPAAILLAQIYATSADVDRAISELEATLGIAAPPRLRRAVLDELGTIWADMKEDPARALEVTRQALDLPGDAAQTRRLAERVGEYEVWLRDGRRPRHEPGDGPGGMHDHNHDHGPRPGGAAPDAPARDAAPDPHADNADPDPPAHHADPDPHADHEGEGSR